MEYTPPDCSLCFESLLEGLVTLECGHVFHALCMYEAHFRAVSQCPVCDKKIDILKAINLDYQLTCTPRTKSLAALTDEEFPSVSALQMALKVTSWENEQVRKEITKLKAVSQYQQQCLNDFKLAVASSDNRIQDLQAQVTEQEQALLTTESELAQYKQLYAESHQQQTGLQQKLSQVEGFEQILQKFESRESAVTWANSVKTSLGLEEQAEQFYNAIVANAHQVQSLLRDREELRSSLNQAKKQCANYKVALEKNNNEVVRHSEAGTIVLPVKVSS